MEISSPSADYNDDDISKLNVRQLEAQLRDVTLKHLGFDGNCTEFVVKRMESYPSVEDLEQGDFQEIHPRCGRSGHEDGFFWNQFYLEPLDKFLLSLEKFEASHGQDVRVPEWDYLCNETNILDRAFRAYDFYRNASLVPDRNCLFQALSDQLSGAFRVRVKANLSVVLLSWLGRYGDYSVLNRALFLYFVVCWVDIFFFWLELFS